MKNRSVFLIYFFIIFLLFINSRFATNLWVLLVDSYNYIPRNSSIFTFKPTKIDDGSGGYWRYGEDYLNYYYFSKEKEGVFFYIEKNNDCEYFDEFNYKTWCEIERSDISLY